MNDVLRARIHFILAALVLISGATGIRYAKSHGLLVIIKKPLPIRKPLRDFDRAAIDPWKLVSAQKFPAEAEEELGTTEYLNWVLAGPEASARLARQYTLTVTYYTGVQDQVPHVPEECAYQGGMTQSGGKTMLSWSLKRLGEKVDLARVVFDDPKRVGQRLIVYYTIAVNGEFHGDRTPVRWRMINLSDTHLYYSKIEVSIHTSTDADIKALDAVAGELLDKALAELLRSHLPKRGWERGGPRTDSDKSA